MKNIKSNKSKWFKQVRGSYIPISWKGWLTYIPYICFLGVSAGVVKANASSSIEAAIGVVPYWVSALVIMSWIAKRKS